MSRYNKEDAAKDTNASIKEVSEAWHQARDDAAEEKGWGVPEDRHHESDSDSKSESSADDKEESGGSGK